jgi:hypothetical protein
MFESQDLPERFKCQILSFVRIEWPELFSGNLRLRDWTTKQEMHPVSFLLEEEGVLISHLSEVISMSLVVLLDAGPLGLITNPRGSSETYQCNLWLES